MSVKKNSRLDEAYPVFLKRISKEENGGILNRISIKQISIFHFQGKSNKQFLFNTEKIESHFFHLRKD